MGRFKSWPHKRLFYPQVFSLSINPCGLVSRGGGGLWDPRQVGECLAVKERKRRLGVELGVVGFGVWGYTCASESLPSSEAKKINCLFWVSFIFLRPKNIHDHVVKHQNYIVTLFSHGSVMVSISFLDVHNEETLHLWATFLSQFTRELHTLTDTVNIVLSVTNSKCSVLVYLYLDSFQSPSAEKTQNWTKILSQIREQKESFPQSHLQSAIYSCTSVRELHC